MFQMTYVETSVICMKDNFLNYKCFFIVLCCTQPTFFSAQLQSNVIFLQDLILFHKQSITSSDPISVTCYPFFELLRYNLQHRCRMKSTPAIKFIVPFVVVVIIFLLPKSYSIIFDRRTPTQRKWPGFLFWTRPLLIQKGFFFWKNYLKTISI